MDTNPFSKTVKKIRNDNKSKIPAYYRIGVVKSIDPLIVDVAGTDQDEDALLKNDLITDFQTGDKLFLVPIEDEQRYIITCKVVGV